MLKNKKLYISIVSAVVILASWLLALICKVPDIYDPQTALSGDSVIHIHFIDVGQGDAAFIDTDDKDILIDAGSGSSAAMLLDYLDELGIYEIEYLFFSHPHEDHIGGGDDILTHYDVSNVVMPAKTEDTTCYRRLMRTIEDEGCELVYASAGDSFDIGELSVEIYSPEDGRYAEDANLVSLIMKLSHGEVDAIFTGDAEEENEWYAIENYRSQLRAQILKVGHHGSSTSTCRGFFEAVSPEVAIISVGSGNPYGHPHRETMSLLNRNLDDIYRTDIDGSVVIESNGEEYRVIVE